MYRMAWILLLFAARLAASAEALEMADVEGAKQRLFDGKPTVLVFVISDCPIANAYTPEINRICETYAKKGVAFFIVHVDPGATAEAAKKHAKDFGYRCPVLIDSAHTLVKRAQATMSPEAAVFAADGSLKYHGRINDLYVELGKKRLAPTTHDLRDALDAVLAGREVKAAKTEAIGCVIAEK